MTAFRCIIVAAIVLAVAGGPAASAETITPVKRCGSIEDPLRPGVTVPVDVAEGPVVACASARKVLRTYLKRVALPRTSKNGNRTVKVGGRSWSCYVSRSVGEGPGWDYVCSSRKTVLGGQLRQ